VREETGYSIWVVQQPKVVGCCPGVQGLTVSNWLAVSPVDMLALDVANRLGYGNVGMTVDVGRERGGL